MKTTFKDIRIFVSQNPEIGYIKAAGILGTTPEVINHAINFEANHRLAKVSNFKKKLSIPDMIEYAKQYKARLTYYYVNEKRSTANEPIFPRIMNELRAVENYIYWLESQLPLDETTIDTLFSKALHIQTEDFIC